MVTPAARRQVVFWVETGLPTEGLVKNHKRTYRIYGEEGLQVRTKKRKKLVRPRVPMVLPTRRNERWSIDFVSDQLSDGRRFRIFNIVDDSTRECVGQLVGSSISGARLVRFMDGLDRRPKIIVCDNGPELTSKAMIFWTKARRIKLQFAHPVSRRKTRSLSRSMASSGSTVSTCTGSDR